MVARNGHLMKAFSFIHAERYTPVPSIIFTVSSLFDRLLSQCLFVLLHSCINYIHLSHLWVISQVGIIKQILSSDVIINIREWGKIIIKICGEGFTVLIFCIYNEVFFVVDTKFYNF